jgi:hypothetical protein
MADRLEELQSEVRELARELRSLEARVGRLEGRAGPGGRLAPTAGEPATAPLPDVAWPLRTTALVGRTLLVLAGAYLARALTDGRAMPAGAGVTIGLAYAVLWQVGADRAAAAGRRESAAFHALASSLIAFPLLWEATARFGLLGARAASLALVGFFGLGLGVAWRRGLGFVAWVVTGLTLGTALAIFLATHDLLAAFAALLAVAAGLEWLAGHERWLALRWAAALLLDALAFLIAALAARPHGPPPNYAPLPPAAAAGVLLALPALYVVSLLAWTLRRAKPVTFFGAAQGTLAVLLGLGGAWKVLAAHGGSAGGLGATALVLGVLCYAAAFAFAGRRAGQGRNFHFYATAGGLLTLAGVIVVAGAKAVPFALAGLGLAASVLGRRFGRTTLRVHGGLYLVAGALGTALPVACARSLAGQAAGVLPPAAWVAGLAAAGGWAVLATDPRATRSRSARVPPLLLAVLVVAALGQALEAGLWAAMGERMADPGVGAAARTAVLGVLALGLAQAARRGAWPEIRWLVYPLVALGGVKLLVQDLRVGRPATLVLSLALYGAVLLLVPRLLRAGGSRAT